MVVSDDTRGEGTTKASPTPSSSSVEEKAWIPEMGHTSPAHFVNKDEQIDALLNERERCHNELQKLKDIVGFSAVKANGDFRCRDSYLPDTGPLYDTVREISHFMFKKVADWPASGVINEVDESDASISGAAAPLRDVPSSDAAKDETANQELALSLQTAQEEAARAMTGLQEQLAVSEQARAAAETQVSALQKDLAALQQELALVSDSSAQTRAQLESSRGVQAATDGELAELRTQHEALKGNIVTMTNELLGEVHGMHAVEDTVKQLSAQVEEHLSSAVMDIEQEKNAAVDRLQKEMVERRRLHNLVLDLKGNIRVFCRSRPPRNDAKHALTFASDAEMLCEVAGKSHPFTFDCVFGPNTQQDTVFAETQPLVVSVLDGYHACILAYGQTGSGKTYTMQGYDNNPGVNTRAISELFDMAKEKGKTHSYSIKVTLLEIYNESLRDLLEPRDETGEAKKLDVKLASSADGTSGFNNGTFVPGVHTAVATCMEDVLDLLKRGEVNRTVAGTDMNERSSRSHMVLSVFVEGTNLNTGIKTFGKLHLIDLAGSERLARSNAEGQQLKEAQNINRSLSALGDCIQSLVAKSKHVPFRNSKLTFLLQDSLGGDSKVLMIVCVSCEDENSNETLCSLNFAARARNVVLGPAKSKATGASDAKLRERERELESSREMIEKLKSAKEELASKLSDASEAHKKERTELSMQVEELESERRDYLKKMEAFEKKHTAMQLTLKSQIAKASAGKTEQEELVVVDVGGDDDQEEGAEAAESRVQKEGSTPRWANPTLSSLAAKKEGVSSTPRGKHLLQNNKENGETASPRVRPISARERSDKTPGGVNDRPESRLTSLRNTKSLRDGINSVPVASDSDKAAEKGAELDASSSASLKASARKEGRIGAGPSRIAKPAERVLSKGVEKGECAKSRFSVGGWR